MPDKKTVNVEGLTRAARQYSNVLRELPFFDYNEVAKALRLNILKVKGEDIDISIRRKAGILRPYKPGLTLGNNQELVKFYESKLKPELVYAELKDNITNYREKKVVSNAGEMVDNKSKKHPLELLILKNVLRSFSEDVIFAFFFAERDDAVASPQTSFNGFFTKLDMLTAAGEISEAKKNYAATGTFDTGVSMGIGADGKNHYTRLVDFIRAAHPLLRRGLVTLICAEGPVNAARDGFRAIVKNHDYPSLEQVIEKLRSDANAPQLSINTHECLGTGDKLILAKPGLLDIGVGDESDKDFVQVRNPYADPNEVQYWIQAAFDTRIKDVHEKLFLTNEQVNTSLNLSGDYQEEPEPEVPTEEPTQAP
ncbi:MAG: hypothetical protein LBI65_01770 [Candidatus Symbiothrix sp.]|jgi:hypothetical protein|nr:hypothetical protein [Candidatus Symbiothrix sp.]